MGLSSKNNISLPLIRIVDKEALGRDEYLIKFRNYVTIIYTVYKDKPP